VRLTRQVITILALAYPLSLLLVILSLRFLGSRFWQVELALYLPRVLFAAPLPVLTILLFSIRRRGLLWTQVVAAWLILFPLMGLVVPGWRSRAASSGPTLRLLSYNGNFAYGGSEALAGAVQAAHPDIAIFQQLVFSEALGKALARMLPEQRTDGEFFIASRSPIRLAQFPPQVGYRNRMRSARFIRYEVESPLGSLVIYSVHPISPLYQIQNARRRGLRALIMSGTLFSPEPRPDLDSDTGLRALQIQTFAARAARETRPVIVAGDTNSPNLSASLRFLDGFHDGFAVAGRGFGYTFPSRRPWMRIDRIFASRQLQFVDFAVGDSLASDHLPVYADLEAPSGPYLP
jgi:vancomycin resistance protein VanJ